MTNVTGYCWATNRYLGELLNVGKMQAIRLIQMLEDCGYIETEVIRDEKNTVIERRIWITNTGLMLLPPGIKNVTTPGNKKVTTPGGKNVTTTMNNNSNNNPPIVPQRGTRSRDHKSTADWASNRFEQLWLWYPGDPERHAKRGNRQRAIRAWDKLRPDDELIETIAAALARQARSDEWQEGVGIPHLSTYLNGYGWEGWTDDNDK